MKFASRFLETYAEAIVNWKTADGVVVERPPSRNYRAGPIF